MEKYNEDYANKNMVVGSMNSTEDRAHLVTVITGKAGEEQGFAVLLSAALAKLHNERAKLTQPIAYVASLGAWRAIIVAEVPTGWKAK